MPTLEQKQIYSDPDCVKCEGRGGFLNDAGAFARCDCHKRISLIMAIRKSGIPQKFLGLTIAGYQPRNIAQTTAKVNMAAWVSNYGDKQTGLLLEGPVGTGKSGLASAMLMAVARLYEIEIRYWKITDLLRKERETFDSGFSDTPPLEAAMHVPLLALDDLGIEKPSEWTQECISDLIDSRYSNNRKTILTTNLDAAGLKAQYGVRVADRLREMCATLVLDGESRR